MGSSIEYYQKSNSAKAEQRRLEAELAEAIRTNSDRVELDAIRFRIREKIRDYKIYKHLAEELRYRSRGIG